MTIPAKGEVLMTSLPLPRITRLKEVQKKICTLERRRGVLRDRLRGISGELHNLNQEFEKLLKGEADAGQ